MPDFPRRLLSRQSAIVGFAALVSSCALWQLLVILSGAQRFPSFTSTVVALAGQFPRWPAKRSSRSPVRRPASAWPSR